MYFYNNKTIGLIFNLSIFFAIKKSTMFINRKIKGIKSGRKKNIGLKINPSTLYFFPFFFFFAFYFTENEYVPVLEK